MTELKEWPLDRFLVEAKEQGLQYVGAMAALDNEGRLDAGEV